MGRGDEGSASPSARAGAAFGAEKAGSSFALRRVRAEPGDAGPGRRGFPGFSRIFRDFAGFSPPSSSGRASSTPHRPHQDQPGLISEFPANKGSSALPAGVAVCPGSALCWDGAAGGACCAGPGGALRVWGVCRFGAFAAAQGRFGEFTAAQGRLGVLAAALGCWLLSGGVWGVCCCAGEVWSSAPVGAGEARLLCSTERTETGSKAGVKTRRKEI